MAIAIPLDRVQQVLAMRIGTALAHSGVGTHAAERLRHYRVGDDLSALCEALRDGLFRDLYAILGPQMRISMPDGRTRRFRMEEFPLLADELLAVLFESLGTTGMPKDTLMAFAMTSGSLCAMRTLMQFYPLSSAEKGLIERILRENAPQAAIASPNQPLF